MLKLSATPTTVRYPFMCPECANAPVGEIERCPRCEYAYPQTYVIPYDCAWSFATPYESNLRAHSGLRLMGKFVGEHPERLQELTHAEYLYLSRYPKLTFDWLRGYGRLRVLELDFLQITSFAGIQEASRLSVLAVTELRRLSDLSALAGLSLVALRMGLCNKVEDYSPIGRVQRLRRFQVEANVVPSVEFLAGLADLRELGLAVNRIGGEWIELIAGLKHLEWLGIRKKALPRGGAERLRTALPDCRIDIWS
jgi:hypothetical protein